jgi:hypothetical protein
MQGGVHYTYVYTQYCLFTGAQCKHSVDTDISEYIHSTGYYVIQASHIFHIDLPADIAHDAVLATVIWTSCFQKVTSVVLVH